MIADIISLLFILPGAFMVFSAAVGTARFNSTLARVHAIAKPQTCLLYTSPSPRDS